MLLVSFILLILVFALAVFLLGLFGRKMLEKSKSVATFIFTLSILCGCMLLVFSITYGVKSHKLSEVISKKTQSYTIEELQEGAILLPTELAQAIVDYTESEDWNKRDTVSFCCRLKKSVTFFDCLAYWIGRSNKDYAQNAFSMCTITYEIIPYHAGEMNP